MSSFPDTQSILWAAVDLIRWSHDTDQKRMKWMLHCIAGFGEIGCELSATSDFGSVGRSLYNDYTNPLSRRKSDKANVHLQGGHQVRGKETEILETDLLCPVVSRSRQTY